MYIHGQIASRFCAGDEERNFFWERVKRSCWLFESSPSGVGRELYSLEFLDASTISGVNL
jgi:hypothetical protein